MRCLSFLLEGEARGLLAAQSCIGLLDFCFEGTLNLGIHTPLQAEDELAKVM